MKKLFNKKLIILFLSFFIPIIMIILYIVYKELALGGKFFYNGENFIISDMKAQYISLYNYIHNVLTNQDSIYYSFHNSLGGNMASTIGYYLASPLNILFMFIKKADIPFMIFIVSMLKLSLCSLFMDILLNYKYGYKYTNLIFSISYAFIGFNSIYYFNIMWLDVIYMTPLVIMGIDKLMDGKPLQYIITLCLSIIFNFYIAYMLCIFCVMYFIYELFIRYNIKDFKSYKKIVLRFIISSLLAGGLSAFFLVPVLFNVKDIYRFPLDYSKFNIDFSKFFYNFFYKIISNTYLGSKDLFYMIFRERPIIYINLFCFMLFILYFFNKNINKKERILSLSVVVFFMLSFMIPHLQLFWQGFSFPNGYIDRFAYLYSFFALLLAAREFYFKDAHMFLKSTIFLIIYLVISFLIIYKNYSFLRNDDIYLCICLMIVYVIFYNFKNFFRNSTKIFIDITLIIIICLELIINYSIVKATKEIYNDKTNYKKYYSQMCQELNSIESNFYRIGESNKYNNLDSYICNFYSINTELSTNNKRMYKFMRNIGFKSTYIAIEYDYATLPILDSLFGIKYAVGDKVYYNYYDLYKIFNVDEEISGNKKIYVYENPYALNIGFAISNHFDKYYSLKGNTRLENLNNYMKALSGINEDVLAKIPSETTTTNNNKKYYINSNTDNVYMIANYPTSINNIKHAKLYVNNDFWDYLTDGTGGINRLSIYDNITKLNFELRENIDIKSIDLYYFDYDVFKKEINILKQNQLENVKTNGNKLSAEINLDRDATVMITIPYDKGWNVYVDGKKVKYREVADTFIGINIPKGNHKIHMVCYPRGMIIGIIISFINLLLTIFYLKNVSKSLNINKN